MSENSDSTQDEDFPWEALISMSFIGAVTVPVIIAIEIGASAGVVSFVVALAIAVAMSVRIVFAHMGKEERR